MGILKRDDEVVDLSAEETVDLTETDLTEAKPTQRWGLPGKCPDCGSAGYLDHIDMVEKVMYQHCTECAHKWTTAQAETVPQSA